MAKEFKRSKAASEKKSFGARKVKNNTSRERKEEKFQEDWEEKKSEKRKPAFIKKNKSSKNNEQTSFKRYRDHGKPSDFGTGIQRSSKYSDENEFSRPERTAAKRSSSGKRPFDNEKPAFKRPSNPEKGSKRSVRYTDENDFSGKEKPFAKRAASAKRRSDGNSPGEERSFGTRSSSGKRPFRKEGPAFEKPSYSKGKKEANPYDLDESDFEYASDNNSDEIPSKKNNRNFQEKRKSSTSSHSNKNDGLMRLNKYISNAGICSRREADELIASGVVQVNGKTITEMGFKVKPTDVIRYGGQTLKKERMVYLILNKPKDYITTVDDPQKRRTVLELVQDACKERIYPVGRLDRSTTGLLMFTNDGELTKKLTHPKYGVRKIYHVELDKPLKKQDLDQVMEGLELEDGFIKVDEISYVGDGKDKSQIGVELHSGKNRIVRRIFEHLGYNVRKLDRVMFGPLTKKDLPRGRWRFLTPAEIGIMNMISSD